MTEASHAFKDLVSGLRPHEGLGMAIRELDVATDGRLEFTGAARPVMDYAELLRLGCAQVMTIQPNVRYAELFLELQGDAREARRGLCAP